MISSLKNRTNKLLFSLSINEVTPVDKFMMSNLVSLVLKEITQTALFVFHCLRHSALSRQQIIIDYYEFNLDENLGVLKKDIIPYDDELPLLLGIVRLKRHLIVTFILPISFCFAP